jgi:hypothetical protein
VFLFNLKEDIGERSNLASEKPALPQGLYREMTTSFKRFGWAESMVAAKPRPKESNKSPNLKSEN